MRKRIGKNHVVDGGDPVIRDSDGVGDRIADRCGRGGRRFDDVDVRGRYGND
ncbi:hypothetical protein D1872_335670 [compost metagenome]